MAADGFCKALLSKIEGAISKQVEFKYSELDEAKFEQIWLDQDLSDEQKFEALFAAMTESRIDQMNWASKYFMNGFYQSLAKKENWYSQSLGRLLVNIAGPHYNFMFNRMAMGKEDIPGPVKTVVVLHETEHGFHRNSNPLLFLAYMQIFGWEYNMVFPTPAGPLFVRRMESRTIGAQWEFAQRIPKEVRARLLQEYESKYDPEQMTNDDMNSIVRTGFFDKYMALGEAAFRKFNRQVKGKDEFNSKQRDFLIRAMIGEKVSSFEKAPICGAVKNLSVHEADKDFFCKVLGDGFRGRVAQSWIKSHALSRVDLGTSEIDSQLEEYRQNLLDGHKKNLLVRMNQIFVATLKYADLPKNEFIKVVLPVHGYSLANIYKNHYKFGSWRRTLAAFSLVQAYIAYHAANLDPVIWAVDIRWIYDYLAPLITVSH